MASIFTRIVQGEIPAHILAETDKFLAFLDVNPLCMGHALVIPKQEIDYVFNLDDSMLGEIMVFAKKIAHAIEKTVPCKRIGIAVIGLEVPHCHFHLVPLNTMNDINFMQEKLSPSNEELAQIAGKIRKNIVQ